VLVWFLLIDNRHHGRARPLPSEPKSDREDMVRIKKIDISVRIVNGDIES
jgi:hypothetical protein